ncbi:MAG: FISUMP domain-containing protein, partial [Bacteroidales bacterium]
VNFTMTGTTSGPCPGIPNITDSRDGKIYNTVQIGTQCWLKENLNIGAMVNSTLEQANNGVIEKYCYDNAAGNCDIYGGLYEWDEMMQYITAPGIQGICPTGWHIPTNDEWTILTSYLGNWVAGGKMKEAGSNHWRSPNIEASNASGFTGLPGGFRQPYGSLFGDMSESSIFWSSTEWLPTHGYELRLMRSTGEVGRQASDKPHGFSVRCIKN